MSFAISSPSAASVTRDASGLPENVMYFAGTPPAVRTAAVMRASKSSES
jgi:hypothetical protein